MSKKEDTESTELKLPDEKKLGISERFDIDNPGEIFKFIQETFFPNMPLEMISDLTLVDIDRLMRTVNQIWLRMEINKRYPEAQLQTDAYVSQMKEYLMLAVSKKRGGRIEVLLHAIGGMPMQQERKKWFR
jgi:hypothetical protein